MKKLVLAAATVLVATMSLASSAQADGRYRDEDEWRRNGQHEEYRDREEGNWDGDRRHHERRDDWRRDRWRHHHGWRHDRSRDGPRVIIRPGYYDRYCFIKKVRRYDDWGNLYIKRVRVCR